MSFWFRRFNTFIWHSTLPSVPCYATILPEDRQAEYRPGAKSIHVDPLKCATRYDILSALLHEMIHLHQDTAGHAGDWHSPEFHEAAASLKALTGLDP